MAGTIRSNKNPGVVIQEQHSDSSRALRTVEHGITIGTNISSKAVGIHDDISAATLVGANRHLLLTNRNAAVQYVTFGAVGVGAATAANGIPLLSIINTQTIVCTGENEYVRASHADVHCVEIED